MLEAAHETLRAIFAKVCQDFEAVRVDSNGEDDHVQLLVEYPPKVAISTLVNSLKGVPRVVSDNSIPTLPHGITRACCGHRVIWLPHVEEHHCRSFVSTLKSNGKTCECFARNALYLTG